MRGAGTDVRGYLGLAAASLGLAAATVAVLAARSRAQPLVEVVPSVGVSETWSDNVDRTPDDGRSGFTTHVTAGLRMRVNGERVTGAGGYALSFRAAHYDGGDTDVDHDAFAGFEHRFTPRWAAYVREDFRLSPDPTRDLAFVTPGGQAFRTFEEAARTPGVDVLDLRAVRVREDVLRHRLAAGTTYDLTPRLSAGGDVIWLVNDSREEVFSEDSQTLGGRLRTTYRLTPVDDVSLASGLEATQFDRSPDATLLRAEVTWDRRLRETVRLSLTGGYAQVSTEDGAGVDDESDFTARAALTGDLTEGQWRLVAARDVESGDGSGDLSERLLGAVSLWRQLGRLTVADVRLRYLQQRSVRGLGTESDVFEGIASVSYRFIRWAAARGAYRYRRDEPAGGGASVDENQVLVGVEVSWPLRERPGPRPDP